MQSEIVLTGIVILILVIFATAKSALDELSDVSIRLLGSEGDGAPRSAFLRSVSRDHHRFSFTLTFGIHLSIATIAILITSLAFKIHAGRFLPIAFAGMLVTVILFRSVIPLLLTQNHPEKTFAFLRYPLTIVYPVMSVIAHPLYHYLRGLQREETPESDASDEHEDDEGELKALIDVGEEEGIIEENEGEMIQSIIRFSDRKVGEVMTPRPNIVAIPTEASLEAVRDLMIESKYSRLPVYRDQLDNIEGIIYVRDLIATWAKGTAQKTASALARPTYFVPETKPIDELLREMQKAKAQMAIVIDEYGGLAGLVTLEDLIEEIVGEIEDEDEPDPQATDAEVIIEADGRYIDYDFYGTFNFRPNAGKSTLLNTLVGEHIAAVSAKPQTTRTRILGIINRPKGQLIFVDTPGIHKPGYALNRRMMAIVSEAIAGVDVIILMRDAASALGAGDRFALDLIKSAGKPVFLLLNKIDLLKDKKELLPLIDRYSKEHDFTEIIPISARTRDGLDRVVDRLIEFLPLSEPLFDSDLYTDQAERTLAAELVREQILAQTGDELPFATAVRTENWRDEGKTAEIHCIIYVERESQKPIVIGRGGQKLKEIGTRARHSIEQMLGRHVRLHLFVRVQPDWRNDERTLDELGIEENRGEYGTHLNSRSLVTRRPQSRLNSGPPVPPASKSLGILPSSSRFVPGSMRSKTKAEHVNRSNEHSQPQDSRRHCCEV